MFLIYSISALKRKSPEKQDRWVETTTKPNWSICLMPPVCVSFYRRLRLEQLLWRPAHNKPAEQQPAAPTTSQCCGTVRLSGGIALPPLLSAHLQTSVQSDRTFK